MTPRIACQPEAHTHPPMLRECLGCGRRVCRPDVDYVATTTGPWFICPGCYEKHRSGWVSSGARA